MLQVFHLDVAYVCNDFQVFICMLQVFNLFRTYVTSVSSGCCKSRSVLYMLQCTQEPSGPCVWASQNAIVGGDMLAHAENEVRLGARPCTSH
jgi:hypothetical protein